MATALDQDVQLSNSITSRLARLRWMIRAYVLAQGIALVIFTVAVCFWVSLAIDYLFEPPRNVRIVILAILAAVVLVVAVRRILLRLVVPLSDKNMAVLLERRNRSLDDRLLTVVELSRRKPDKSGYDPRMLANTLHEVNQLIPSARLGRVFRAAPLGNATILAAVFAASIVLFGFWQVQAVQIWANRSLMLGDRQWPRETRIFVEGFPEVDGQRLVKVARGSDLMIRAGADTKLAIPDAVQVRYETGEASGRPNMTRLKDAVPGRDPAQFYEYEFKNIQDSIDFEVVALHGGILGKNDRVDDLKIVAVESPDFADAIMIGCKFPKYLGMNDETFSVRVVKPLPEGTDVTIKAKANKDLVAAQYRLALDDPDAAWQDISLDKRKPRHVELALGVLRSDTRVEFQLHDVDDVTNQQPIRLLLRITPDEAPRVDVQLVGVGKAVTPVADLPIRGTIWDDHGLSKSWFDFSVDQGDAQERTFEVPSGGELNDTDDVLFGLEDLGLTPGQQLTLIVKAADNYALADEPHVGVGQRYDLQIVSEAELRGMLETRERILRRRFESVIAEMQRSRDALSRMTGEPDDSGSSSEDAGDGAAAGDPAARGADEGTDKGADADKQEPVEAGSEAEPDAAETPSARLATIRVLRTEEAIQTSDRMAHETREVAAEFDRILLELDNNNVSFLEEFERRIGEGISDPLKRIADKGFPALDDRLAQLRRVLEDDDRRLAAILAARQEVDAILADMDQILQKMLELREFNELLAILREIIDGQQQVTQLTEEMKKKLLEDLKKSLLD